MGLYVLGYQGLGTEKCNIPDLGMDKAPEDICFLKRQDEGNTHFQNRIIFGYPEAEFALQS